MSDKDVCRTALATPGLSIIDDDDDEEGEYYILYFWFLFEKQR